MVQLNSSELNSTIVRRMKRALCLYNKSLYIIYNRSFSSDVTAAILVYQNNEMAAILVYGTGISSFLFKYFVLFHHPTGASDHVSENDLLRDLGHLHKFIKFTFQISIYKTHQPKIETVGIVFNASRYYRTS